MTGPDFLIPVLAGATAGFAVTTLWMARAHYRALKKLDAALHDVRDWKKAAQTYSRDFAAADRARLSAVTMLDRANAKHQAYVAAEPDRFRELRRSHLKAIGDKGRARQAALRVVREA